jgi:hypothetical protein
LRIAPATYEACRAEAPASYSFVCPSKEIIMTDRDHNRSNNSGTGAKTLDRDPRSDTDLIENEPPTPSQSGSSGGDMQREIGSIDEEKTATGADAQPTSVHKGMKPEGGDEPNLPDRGPPRESSEKVPPRRSR